MRGHYPNIKESTVPDHGLAGAVLRALGESADVDIREVNVDAANGLVRLTGAVDTLFEKRKAGQTALAVDGVTHVENSLVVSPTKPADDKALYETLDRALGDYPNWQPAAVGVREVCNGIAYIAGSVTSAEERRLAGWIAAKVPGVKQVVNEIDIAPREPLDDVTIQTLVSDAISDDPRIDPFEVEISVEDGRVTLEGEVEDTEAVRAGAQLAAAVPGVKGVFNRLKARE